ncbi:MAG: DUF485 domain-containing protein [Bryobacterales bacterium]|nr:DUF485 domain-containing protein [Bryobacterales bacterium]
MIATPLPDAAENARGSSLSPSRWDRIAAGADFQALLRAKSRFIVAATLFFLGYYFALPIFSGYFPDLMSRKVVGQFSLAYVFALSQFPMAWIVAALYLRASSRFDRDAAAILARHQSGLNASEENAAE